MSRKPPPSLLDEAVGLLVHHFGGDRVHAALRRVANGTSEASLVLARRRSPRSDHRAEPSVTRMLENLRRTDEPKHRLLANFHADVRDKKLLPESQDIRHFAQLIGLKEIGGKSRKEMIPTLMRFLVQQPSERLRVDLDTATTISEHQRRQGFSVLTDKLLGKPASRSDRDPALGQESRPAPEFDSGA